MVLIQLLPKISIHHVDTELQIELDLELREADPGGLGACPQRSRDRTLAGSDALLGKTIRKVRECSYPDRASPKWVSPPIWI
jgi:hypothetical protein